MKLAKTLILFFLQFIFLNAFSFGNDSLLFIDQVKKFAFKEIGVELRGDLFTKWSPEEKPYVYLYVSLPDSIKKPVEVSTSFIFCGTDQEWAIAQELIFQEKGFHTFCYKTNANSAALLNKRLMSYSKDAITFIVFHELIHNLLFQQNIKIPYEFNEALCDVIGNYGALEFSKSYQNLGLASVKNQIKNNEKIYKCLNKSISRINKKPEKTIVINASCNRKIQQILKSTNSFQKDRFNYDVNNAYLLKNEYYSKNYFLLKKVLLKQKAIESLLEIMKSLPENSSDCTKYLKKFT